MRNISHKIRRENQKHTFLYSNFFSPENRAVYEMMWKNMGDLEKPQTIIKYGASALRA
jgi:hypothetical protein